MFDKSFESIVLKQKHPIFAASIVLVGQMTNFDLLPWGIGFYFLKNFFLTYYAKND